MSTEFFYLLLSSFEFSLIESLYSYFFFPASYGGSKGLLEDWVLSIEPLELSLIDFVLLFYRLSFDTVCVGCCPTIALISGAVDLGEDSLVNFFFSNYWEAVNLL